MSNVEEWELELVSMGAVGIVNRRRRSGNNREEGIKMK